jgi:cytochrome c-type biogenesis protein CcmH/NrfF
VRLLLVVAAALALAAPALASEQHPTLPELEGEVMCIECHTTLDMSSSPFADRVRFYIRRWIREGDTKSEIKRKLVAQFGPAILAEPPKRGFGLLAWLLPAGGVLLGAAAVGVGAWKWSRFKKESDGCVTSHHAELDAASERLVDDALARFDG